MKLLFSLNIVVLYATLLIFTSASIMRPLSFTEKQKTEFRHKFIPHIKAVIMYYQKYPVHPKCGCRQ